ncbi:hypothetical protein D3C83_101130 [compost metagenome]
MGHLTDSLDEPDAAPCFREIAELAVEVAQVALRMVDDADGEVGESSEPLGEQPHDDAFAGAGIAVDEREAALAQCACSMRQQNFSTCGGT